MSSVQGNKFANYRYDPISGVEVAESITAEIGVVALLSPELSTRYGFELLECPQSDPPGIVSVTRVSDSAAFSYVATAPGALQYFIDYTNNSPVLIFNSSENGASFTVAYNGVGAPDSVNNSRLIEESTRGIIGVIRSKRTSSVTISADTTKTISAKHASVYHLTIDSTKTLTVDGAVQGQGVLHVYGDLTVNGTLSLKRILLIVYGNIYGTGTISCPASGSNGGNGAPGADGVDSLTEMGGIKGTGGGVSGGGGGGGGIDGTTGGNGGTVGNVGSNANGYGAGGGGNGAGPSSGGGNGGSTSSGFTKGGCNRGGDGGATTGTGTSGGGGGGGLHLNVFAFGTIAATLTLRTGLPGLGGTGTDTATPGCHGQGGWAGDLNLYSQYTSSPCTVQVSVTSTYGDKRDGTAGTANYNSLDSSNIFGILQELTGNCSNVVADVDHFGYLFWTKQGSAF